MQLSNDLLFYGFFLKPSAILFHLSRFKYTHKCVMAKCTVLSETVQKIKVQSHPSEMVSNVNSLIHFKLYQVNNRV